MSDLFDNITTRMDIRKSSVDTTYDKDRSKSRAIKKVPYTVVVPSTNIWPYLVASGNYSNGAMFAQFNYTAPSAFRFLDAVVQGALSQYTWQYLICIKYRINQTVYRYSLPFTATSLQTFIKVQATPYTNQLIKANFSIELYHGSIGHPFLGSVTPELTFNTNLLTPPVNVNETTESIALQQTLVRYELVGPIDNPTAVNAGTLCTILPDVLPDVYDAGVVWLSN